MLHLPTSPFPPGAPCDPETAHLWLSRTVRQLLRVESLSAIPESASRFTAAAVTHHQHQQLAAAAGEAGEAAAERLSAAVRVSTSLAALTAALDAPCVHMLGWSAMVLGESRVRLQLRKSTTWNELLER